jgi:hypothetical protein
MCPSRSALLALALSLFPALADAQYLQPEHASMPFNTVAEIPAYLQAAGEFVLTSHATSEPVPAPEAMTPEKYDGWEMVVKDPMCYPRRYVQVDGLIWHRVGTGCNQVLALDISEIPELPVLGTDELNFDPTGGARVLVGWRPGHGDSHCSAWELSYFGLYGWQARGRVTGQGDLAIPGDLGLNANNFQFADEIDVRYRSNLHNLELNCIKSCCQCGAMFDFLGGVRFLYLDESFSLVSNAFAEETVGTYNINTDNYLYGFQFGGRYTRPWSRWWVQLVGKAGVFLNDAHQSQRITDAPLDGDGNPFELRPYVSSRGQSVAALGELGVTAIRPINATWSLRLGYSALGLGGVALAPGQLDFTDTDASGRTLNRSGWVFLHGGLVGLEAVW